MANLLMHPRADSLTFLFTAQRGCEKGCWGRDGVRAAVAGGGAKCCFSFNHPVVSCPHKCCWFATCHSQGIVGLLFLLLKAATASRSGGGRRFEKNRQLVSESGSYGGREEKGGGRTCGKEEIKHCLQLLPVWTLWAPPRYTSAQWESASGDQPSAGEREREREVGHGVVHNGRHSDDKVKGQEH